MKWRFLILIITLSFPHYSYAQQNPLLEELSRVIDEREVYIQEKYYRINLLQRKLGQKEPISAKEQFLLIDDLVKEYRSFNFDSAFVYAILLQHIARELGGKKFSCPFTIADDFYPPIWRIPTSAKKSLRQKDQVKPNF